jgi:hypothetical protein
MSLSFLKIYTARETPAAVDFFLNRTVQAIWASPRSKSKNVKNLTGYTIRVY